LPRPSARLEQLDSNRMDLRELNTKMYRHITVVDEIGENWQLV